MKYAFISIVCFLSGSHDAFGNDTTYTAWQWFLKSTFAPRPIYAHVAQSGLTDNSVGVTDVDFGFDGETKNGAFSGIDYNYGRSRSRIQFLNAGLSYKKYADNPGQSSPFLNGYLCKLNHSLEFPGGLAFTYNANIFDKKTTLYSNTDIEWFSGGMGIGFDVLRGFEDMQLMPVFYYNLGFSTYKPDTLVFPNIPDGLRNVQYELGVGGIKLYGMYKSFDIYAVYSGAIGRGHVYRSQLSGEISYTFWKENQTDAKFGGQEKYYQNNFKVFAGFSTLTYSSVRYTDSEGNHRGYDYDYMVNMFKAGISCRLGKFFNWRLL